MMGARQRFWTGLCLLLAPIAGLWAQQPYFVDGYHGGIYGHYPLWVTSFMLDHLDKQPAWRVGLEIEPETWDTVRLKDPAGYARLRQWSTDPRLDFTNPTYAQPYLYNISGESIIRQFAYGMARYRRHFPDIRFTTYAVEEPCFTSSLPQLLRQFGFDYAVLKCPNTCWGGYTRAHGGAFLNWVGPDGTGILTVPRYANEALEQNSTWQTTAWANTSSYWKSCFDAGISNPVGMCYQDAGWDKGPWLGGGNELPNGVRYSTWTEYFKAVAPGQPAPDWRLSQEDLLVNLMWGSQVLQQIAQQVRTAENKMIQAEKIAAMAYIERGFVPDSSRMDEAWRTLMLAQHHDSWIVPYNRLHKGQTWAQAIRQWTDSSIAAAEDIIAAADAAYAVVAPDRQAPGYVRVYNTLAAPRTDLVQVALPAAMGQLRVLDSRGQLIPSRQQRTALGQQLEFKATVQGFGYATYRLAAGSGSRAPHKGVQFDAEGNCILENDMYRIVLDRKQGGTIRSLKAKFAGNQEFAAQQGAYRMGEIAGHFYEEGKFHSSKDHPAVFRILRDDALSTLVEIKGQINGHPFVQQLALEAGQQRIDMDLRIDWKGNVGIGEYRQQERWTDNRRAFTDDRYKLKVMFPVDFAGGKVFKDAPFDVTESRLEDTHFGQWDQIKNNVVLHWLDLYDAGGQRGLAVLTDHTGSYAQGSDFPLSLTAQYSGKGLWGMDYSITGPLHMRYALIPHRGNWLEADIAGHSNAWNEPLVARYHRQLDVHDRQLVRLPGGPLEISALHLDQGQLKLRLYNGQPNASNAGLSLNFPLRALRAVQLNGADLGEVALTKKKQQETAFNVKIPPYGIQTFLINP